MTVGLALLVVFAVVVISQNSHRSTRRRSTNATLASHAGVVGSIEAGVEPWELAAPISREAVVANGGGLTIVGGLESGGASASGVFTLDPTTGKLFPAGTIPDGVHDAGASVLGAEVDIFGGGSPTTVATVEQITQPAIPASGVGSGQLIGSLPSPRSDLAALTLTNDGVPTAYLVGGYDGTNATQAVLSTTDGIHYSTVANLLVPVRYPAVTNVGGSIYVFGGETVGATPVATSAIQRVDVRTHKASIVGHLRVPTLGAAAFTIDGTPYVAGGEDQNGITLTKIYAFVPGSKSLLNAGLLPQAEAFGGYTTVGTGAGATGYIVGGQVASQSGPDQAGVASGMLSSVLSLRLSPYGGPAGTPSSGSPFTGTLLIADRGNNRLLAMGPNRAITWVYPSASKPAPPGGFYFPDDAFFIRHGTGIISNEENNHTIVEIGYPSGKILFQYGHPGIPGTAPGYLDQPDDAYLLRNGTITVADASNNRVLFISQRGQVTGQIGNGVDAHVLATSLAYPNGDTPLADGNVLISEINGSYVDEYTPSGKVVWSIQLPTVNYPSDPQQIGPDLYLIADYNPSGEGRIVEFDRAGEISWEYDVTAGDAMLKRPSLAERLPNGLIMANDDYNDRLIVIDPATKEIVWQYGLTATRGTTTGLLSIPDGFDLLDPGGVTPTHPTTG